MVAIVLIGFMGTGKSTIAQSLAETLGYQWRDLDQAVVEAQGMTIADIFQRYGEPYFRQLEHQILSQCLHSESMIIATGGGVVINEANRWLLQAEDAYVINLTAEPQVVLQRVTDDGLATRPVLTNEPDPLVAIEQLMDQRKPLYQIADYEVDTSDRSIPEIVQMIEEQLAMRGVI